MAEADTSGSHGAAAFPSTCWSDLAEAASVTEARAREALDTLAARYFRPVAAYVRARWAKTDDDAFDAAQEFFLWVLESEFFGRADPERGSFRGFIKRALVNFLHDSERKRRTWKRGGTRRFVPVDGEGDGGPLEIPDRAASPDEALDGLWRQELLAQAADALEAELATKGKRKTFDVFRDYFLGDDELDYASVAERHGISVTDVSNALAHAKRRYRAHLRNAVADTVRGDDDLRAELAWLFEETPERRT